MTDSHDHVIMHVAAIQRVRMADGHRRERPLAGRQMQYALYLDARAGEANMFLSYFLPCHNSRSLAPTSFS